MPLNQPVWKPLRSIGLTPLRPGILQIRQSSGLIHLGPCCKCEHVNMMSRNSRNKQVCKCSPHLFRGFTWPGRLLRSCQCAMSKATHLNDCGLTQLSHITQCLAAQDPGQLRHWGDAPRHEAFAGHGCQNRGGLHVADF